LKVTLHSTTKIVHLNGVPARIWEGHTFSGIPVHCYITRVAVAHEQDATEFEQSLQDHAAPSPEIATIPIRLIL
jgi:hypothetical protein